MDPEAEAASYVDPEKGVESMEGALSGARDIIAEQINEDQTARARMRSYLFKKGVFVSKAVPGKEAEGAKYKDYFEWTEPVSTAPSHRVLAMRRGEKEGFLSLTVAPPDEEEALAILEDLFVKGTSACSSNRSASSSGPRRSVRGVNPSISQNITVACFRSPSILSL